MKSILLRNQLSHLLTIDYMSLPCLSANYQDSADYIETLKSIAKEYETPIIIAEQKGYKIPVD